MIGSSLALAGGMEGGGGKSVVCRDNNHKIISAELLDIWEGKNIYNLNIEQKNDVDSILSIAQNKLTHSLTNPEVSLFRILRRVRSIMMISKPGVILKDVNDAAEVALPADCKLEQLANYVDDNFLIVSNEIWNQLDDLNKAGLILHEAIYRFERDNGATNSRRARKIVAHLLSDFQFTKVNDGLPINIRYCQATNDAGKLKYGFWVYPISNIQGRQMSKLQFTVLDGLFVYSKKTAVIPVKLPWEIPEQSRVFSGGDTDSNFEGNDYISLGAINEVTTTPDSTTRTSYLYLLSSNDPQGDGDKFQISCGPMRENDQDGLQVIVEPKTSDTFNRL